MWLLISDMTIDSHGFEIVKSRDSDIDSDDLTVTMMTFILSFFSAFLVLCVQTLSVSSLHRHPAICNPQFCLVCASIFNGPDYKLACNDIGTILCIPLLSTILTRLGLLCHPNPISQQTYRIIVIKLCSSMLGSRKRCDCELHPSPKVMADFFQTQQLTWCPYPILKIFGGCIKCMQVFIFCLKYTDSLH